MLLGESDAASLPAPYDDYWYSPFNMGSANVTPDTAKRVAAVYSCERVIKSAIASLPCIIYRKLPDGGKERAVDHPLYYLLHSRPNQRQTAFEYWELNSGHIELRGNAYSQIVGGPDSAIEQLIPLHPDRMQVKILPNGRPLYEYRDQFGMMTTFAMEEIFHLRGASSDGYVGMSPITVNRETIGLAMSAQDYGVRFFENDSTPSGALEHPGELSEEAQKRLRDSFQKSQTGKNRHKVAIFEEGMQYKPIGITNKDAQFLELRKFSRAEICSIFGVPPHKIGDLERATFANIEQQAIEFATDCIRPRLKRIEARINTDLIDALAVGEPGEYFCEFLMDALLRGDLKSRYEAYAAGINAGWLVRNEARAFENLNRIEGLDEPLRPMNTTSGTTVEDPAAPIDQTLPANEAPATDDATAAQRRVEVFARAAAERMVRKEVSAIRKLSVKGGTREEVAEFYAGHVKTLAAALHIPTEDAQAYVDGNFGALEMAEDVEPMLTRWETSAVAVLTDLAMKEL